MCEHFPLIDQLDFADPVKANYRRLTHESHPRHMAYRRDLESYLATGAFAPRERAVPTEAAEGANAVATAAGASLGAPPTARLIPPKPEVPSYPPPGSTEEEIAAWSHAKVHGRIVSLNPHMERLALVAACDYRGEQLQGAGGGCGCTRTWHCGRGTSTFKSSPNEVSLSDCIRCVTSQAEPVTSTT